MDPTILNEIQRSLGRIEGKQDSLLQNHAILRKDYDDLREDVETLRSRINWYAGATATIGSGLLLFKEKIMAAVFGG